MRQLSGKEESFEVSIHTTIKEFKRQLHVWLPCEDEAKRNMSSVEVVVGDRPLLNNAELVSKAIPGANVLAFLSIKSVTCSSFASSRVEREDLRVVEFPGGVTEIERSAFCKCSSLAKVTIPDSVSQIRARAFQGCSSLANVTIPDSVTVIGSCAFQGCSSLASVIIPNSVAVIGDFAFRACSSLANVTIPNSVTQITRGAFLGCSSLADVTISDFTEIGAQAFRGCSLVRFGMTGSTSPPPRKVRRTT